MPDFFSNKNSTILKSLFGVGLTSLITGPGIAQKPAVQKLPNVILILIDDMGYGDLGCFGATQYRTPNIDRLAANGMRFTNFYAAQAVSSASRAGLLTGCYSNRVGITGALMPWDSVGINPEEELIPELLATKGYKNAVVGKWHVGCQRQFLPLQNGFDEYFGLPYSNDMWPVDYDGLHATKDKGSWLLKYPPLPLIKGNETVKIIETLEDQAQLTTSYTEYAVDFIKRNKANQFFLYMAHSMTHVPLAVSDKFKGKSKQGLYGDVVMEVDWSVGEIMNTLEKNGLAENTLVVFMSDNGPWLNFGNHAGSSGGLREGKGCSWEGGQRVPCIMSWPARIPSGEICNSIASTIDILPTLCNITGATLPKKRIDGVNIISLLEGNFDSDPRDVFFYYYGKNSLENVRKGQWKLVLPHRFRSYEGVMPGNDGWPGKYTNGKTDYALYDLRRDPGERYDVKELYPEVVEDLKKLVDEMRLDLGDDNYNIPGANIRNPGSIKRIKN
ncbi:MAG: sulfatase [Bacteroidales bacterium]|nr:sulfatase [Bacteroidales bacterium]